MSVGRGGVGSGAKCPSALMTVLAMESAVVVFVSATIITLVSLVYCMWL